jgi:hypothetical protein
MRNDESRAGGHVGILDLKGAACPSCAFTIERAGRRVAGDLLDGHAEVQLEPGERVVQAAAGGGVGIGNDLAEDAVARDEVRRVAGVANCRSVSRGNLSTTDEDGASGARCTTKSTWDLKTGSGFGVWG